MICSETLLKAENSPTKIARTGNLPAKEEFSEGLRRWELASALGCLLVTLYAAAYPLYRTFFPVEVSYNEGWNIYNAWMVAHHIPLYGSAASWTTVNYPGLSFWLIAQLSRLTHDYLYTGRALSLLGLAASALFTGLIVRRLTRDRLASVLAALICVALFCSVGDFYVGADDPQLLSQAFFVGGLMVYVLRRESDMAVATAALLFAVGGSIKHNQIDFPLAVGVDLWLMSRRRARKYFLLLAGLGALVVWANTAFGGHYFLQRLLTPRSYSVMHLLDQLGDYYPTLLIPFVAACAAAVRAWRNQQTRVIAIFFAISLPLGLFFSGGVGVWFNAYFSNTLAMAILLGLGLHWVRQMRLPEWNAAPYWRAGIPLVFFLWMLIPMACNDILSLPASVRKVRAQNEQMHRQIELLRSQPGPVLCESLLRCYLAGKPYVYDPFNSTSLVRAGRLNAQTLVQQVQQQKYGAIEMYHHPDAEGRPVAKPERFVDDILLAAANSYQVVQSEKDCTIYLPKKSATLAAAKIENSGEQPAKQTSTARVVPSLR